MYARCLILITQHKSVFVSLDSFRWGVRGWGGRFEEMLKHFVSQCVGQLCALLKTWSIKIHSSSMFINTKTVSVRYGKQI